MKVIRIIIFASMLQAAVLESYSQQFTKIITGDLVNTPGDYRSVNWIDYDNDGLIDLQITNGNQAGDNNKLYHNDGGGNFSAVANSPLVSDSAPSDGSTWADIDNDGDADCFTVNYYGLNNMFYINNGNGTFRQDTTSVIAGDGGYSETASWGDYDNDGYIDLYVCNSGGTLKNYLYHNDGNGTFSKVITGLPVTNQFTSRSINWTDYDSDGDLDIFVTNEGSTSENENLYRNDGAGIFTRITSGPLVSDAGKTMSSSWADFDNDGDPDVVLANDHRNNSLFRNDGNGVFVKMDTDTVSLSGGNSFGSNWGDIDNDGDQDLLITNSFYGTRWQNFLYINNGDGTFSRDASTIISQDSGWSYGCAFGDYDNDGFLDVAIANCFNASQSNSLYHNAGNANHWLEIKCEGTISNRSAIGAKVKVKSTINGAEIWQLREISAQSGYCGQNMLTTHFGTATSTLIDSLKIEWPSGLTDVYTDINADQILTAVEGQGLVGDDEEYPVLTSLSNYPNPFSDDTMFEFSLNENSSFNLSVYDLKGNKIATLADGSMEKGTHRVKWNSDGVKSGVYVYVLKSGSRVMSKKAVVR